MLAYSGRGKFALQSIRLSEVVEEMTHLLEVSISKKCALKFCFPHKLPYIEGDVTQVRQVIMNLIINASEAIGDQSGVITVSTGVVDCDHAYLSETYLVDDLPPGTYVYLEVADTGCGMTPEVRSRIFDPFFTTKFTGRGLGLAAVLGIIRGHRGAIKVYSEVGRGTTFKALFPVPKQEGTSAAKAAAAPEVWHGTGTILVIDDERVVRELAKEVLGKIGFTVLTASDGREGLEVFRARVNEICLVLLDLTMPHMDGEETFRDLRRGRSDVRVILSSGYNEQDATQRFTGKGLAGFIHKPYRAEDLTEAVRKALEPGPEASGQGSPRKNGGTHQDSHP
jgi:CheY-like chemotaxis protein